jgi:hypothetical protein
VPEIGARAMAQKAFESERLNHGEHGEHGESKTEGRRQKAEGRRQKAEGRRQNTHDRSARSRDTNHYYIFLPPCSPCSPWFSLLLFNFLTF